MIVCICHRVSDRDIQRAVGEGTTSFEVLQDDTRLATSCGCCHECAREVFEAACAKQGVHAGHRAEQPIVFHTARA